jgi:glycosyltransferase involved in cell wall biosynthesis
MEASNELLSIFFPMWNEEPYIERAIAESKAVCEQLVADGEIGDYELIIVDDKSTDRTPEIADALAVADHRFDRTGEGYTRAIYTFFYNLLIRTMFGVKARDINFAFKLVRRNVLDAVDLRSEGSFIDAELIIRAIRSGFELQQFGVDYFPRTMGESTLSSPGVIQTIIKEMYTLRGELEDLKNRPRGLNG